MWSISKKIGQWNLRKIYFELDIIFKDNYGILYHALKSCAWMYHVLSCDCSQSG